MRPWGQGQASGPYPGVNSVSGQEVSQREYLVLSSSEENHVLCFGAGRRV